MDIFPFLTELAKWTGWPFVAMLSILGGGIALWSSNQNVEKLNQRIESLKEMNDWLKTKLADAQQFTPSALVERYAARHKILSEELELLYSDYKTNEKRIDKLETEKKGVADELDNIASSLFKAVEGCSFNCLFCSAKDKNVRQVGIPIKREGERFIIDIETICRGCGHKTISISQSG